MVARITGEGLPEDEFLAHTQRQRVGPGVIIEILIPHARREAELVVRPFQALVVEDPGRRVDQCAVGVTGREEIVILQARVRERKANRRRLSLEPRLGEAERVALEVAPATLDAERKLLPVAGGQRTPGGWIQ